MIVPIHTGTLGKGLEHKILKQAGLLEWRSFASRNGNIGRCMDVKHYYPAVFETAEEGGYTVTVPDIDG